jgi:hypothetical protein
LLASFLFKSLLEFNLHVGGICIIIEVNLLEYEAVFSALDDVSKNALGKMSFSSACETDHQDWMSDLNKFVDEIFIGYCFLRG